MDEDYKKQILEWYEIYSAPIYRYILLMIGDHEQAKDLTHDTFLKAYSSNSDFQGMTSDKNWLYRIARNVAIDYMRKRKPIRFLVESIGSLPSPDGCPESIIQLVEDQTQLFRSLRKLKRSYQEVIILRKIQELSIQETAEVLNWKESKVKTTLFRALSALKKQMVKEGYEHGTIQ
ncbi:RNA polymerase sigma factor [Radiobacillus sp. PE A8.2]|uniref:RNA polymerase sigma factor n=1 Tax=Radiobacillus sp. PE A8.2 TaxID=3380349 RepID=UPI00388F2DDC